MSDLDTYNPFETPTGLRHQRPLWIWDRGRARFIWANGAGIEFWGAAGLSALQAMSLDEIQPVIDCASEAVDGLSPGEGVEMTLQVPHGSLRQDYHAHCRAGQLQGRSVVIVELMRPVSARALFAENATERNTPLLNGSPAYQGRDAAPDGNTSPLLPEKLKIDDEGEAQSSSVAGMQASGKQPRGQLTELARLIEAAQQENDELDETDQRPVAAGNLHEPMISEAKKAFEELELDIVALKGAGNGEEIDELLASSPAPVALIHVPRILHANDMFVSEFGYGDFSSLGNDGTDWIFPQSREMLNGYLQSSMQNPLVIRTVRLCSGRVMERPLYLIPLRLTRYNRVVLLGLLSNGIGGDGKAEIKGPQGALLEALNEVPLLSLISHEVRTPLNVISGFAEMMSHEAFGPLGHQKYAEYASDIQQSAGQALAFVNDMLDLSKFSTGHWAPEAKPVELNEIVRKEVHLLRGLAAERQVKLCSLLEENLPQVMVDERVLVQILINLIGNGLKFNKPGGQVTVGTELRERGAVMLSVEDTGLGMSAEELERALHPFEQIQNGNPSFGIRSGSGSGRFISRKGSGLGLAIVKALAKASKIGFTLTSTANEGTKASLLFPARC